MGRALRRRWRRRASAQSPSPSRRGRGPKTSRPTPRSWTFWAGTASAGAMLWLPWGAASPGISRASPPPPISGAWPSARCLPASWRRWIPPWAARPASTFPRGKTRRAASTSPPWCSATRRCSRPFRSGSTGAAAPRSSSTACSLTRLSSPLWRKRRSGTSWQPSSPAAWP